jgi:hypothetical protein
MLRNENGEMVTAKARNICIAMLTLHSRVIVVSKFMLYASQLGMTKIIMQIDTIEEL